MSEVIFKFWEDGGLQATIIRQEKNNKPKMAYSCDLSKMADILL